MPSAAARRITRPHPQPSRAIRPPEPSHPEALAKPARPPLLRRLGLPRLAVDQWVRRGVFLLGGLCVGGAAVLMALLADKAQLLFRHLAARSELFALAVPPLGFAACVLLARTVFPNSQGSGIPQVIAARQVADAARRNALVSLRTTLGKVAVMTVGLTCGASIGREGPTVQVGASIMGFIGRRAPVAYQQNLLLAGASAGIAAAFNTPLAGIVFGIEELSRSFEAKSSGLVIGCIIAAGMTSLALLGDYTYFGSTAAVLPLGRVWLVVPAMALAGGLLGGLFSRIVVACLTGDARRGVRWFAVRWPVGFAALCGAGVALCGLCGDHVSYGTGYEEARAILHGQSEFTRLFMPLKFLSTVFSSVSGIPGGLFAPSLSVGAGLGAEFHALFASIPVGALALVGMASYLTGVVQTPITSFVIVSEMTEDHAMVIPLMVAALIADAVSRLVCKDGLYHTLARTFMPQDKGDGSTAGERAAGTAAEPT